MGFGFPVKKSSSVFDLFDRIENTPGSNDKIDLLKQANEDHKKLLKICFDPFRQYGVKKWNDEDSKNKFVSDKQSLDEFYELVNFLETHNSSNDSIFKVSSFLSKCTPIQKKYYSRIIKKDLRIGISVVTINKVFSKLIPKFEVMLANRYGSGTISEFPEMDKLWLYQPKLDGFRNVLYAWEGETFSRSGKPVANQNIQKLFEPFKNLDFVFDGEFYSHEIGFGEISSILRSKNEEIPEHLHFVVWDMIPKYQWINRLKTISYEKRIRQLHQLLEKYHQNIIKPVPFTFIKTKEGYYKDFITGEVFKIESIGKLYSEMLKLGYEGLMVKDPEAPYEWRRSRYSMYKIKPEEYLDALIIGVYEGKGRNEGKLGGLVVEFEEDIVNVNVGGGFSDVQRDEFWANPPIGRWCEIKYTEITKNLSGTNSLRHPRFHRLRENKI